MAASPWDHQHTITPCIATEPSTTLHKIEREGDWPKVTELGRDKTWHGIQVSFLPSLSELSKTQLLGRKWPLPSTSRLSTNGRSYQCKLLKQCRRHSDCSYGGGERKEGKRNLMHNNSGEQINADDEPGPEHGTFNFSHGSKGQLPLQP